MITCSRCGVAKSANEFAERHKQCRACIVALRRENPYTSCFRCGRHASQVKLYSNGWCRDCTRAARDPEYHRAQYDFKRRKRLKAAGLRDRKRCQVCGSTNNDGRALHIDHDHKTGLDRGLLCFRCNSGIGSFSDNPTLLRKAAEYLESCNNK